MMKRIKRIMRSYEMTPKRREPDLSTYAGRFAARLRALRERKGLTVEEVASSLSVSYRAVYYWELAQADPKISYLPKLAELYGLKSPRSLLPND